MTNKARTTITVDPALLDKISRAIDELNDQMEGKKMTLSSFTSILYEQFLENLIEINEVNIYGE